MPTLAVSSEALGTDYSVRISGQTLRRFEGDPLPDEFVLGDSAVRTLSVEDVFPIFDQEVPLLVNEAMRRSHESVRPGEKVDWQMALGTSRFVKSLKRVATDCESAIDEIMEEKYLPQLKKTREILTKLQPAHVDKDILEKRLSSGYNGFLESFRPVDGETCQPVRYSHDTATGRLTVSSGPKILNLSREHRDILKSRFRKGAIGFIDFVSLEPRTALLLTRPEAPQDIYEAMRSEIGSQHSRAQLKVATISALYGQRGESSIPSAVIGRFFRVPQIHERYLNGWDMGNLYGRKLVVDDERLKLPYFVQSTAVDVALTGFSKILSRFAEMVPLFVIHDALVVDAEKDLLAELSKTGLEVDIEPLGKFYLSVKTLGDGE
jgi:hypothetical protein